MVWDDLTSRTTPTTSPPTTNQQSAVGWRFQRMPNSWSTYSWLFGKQNMSTPSIRCWNILTLADSILSLSCACPSCPCYMYEIGHWQRHPMRPGKDAWGGISLSAKHSTEGELDRPQVTLVNRCFVQEKKPVVSTVGRVLAHGIWDDLSNALNARGSKSQQGRQRGFAQVSAGDSAPETASRATGRHQPRSVMNHTRVIEHHWTLSTITMVMGDPYNPPDVSW